MIQILEQIQMINLYKECKDSLINEIFNKDKIPKKDKQKKLRDLAASEERRKDKQNNEDNNDNQNIDSEQNDKKTADN